MINGLKIKVKPGLNKLDSLIDNYFTLLKEKEVWERGSITSEIRHVNVGEKNGRKLVCVVFQDGSHIIKECNEQDSFDVNVGVALCLVKKRCSNTQFHKLIQNKLTCKSKELLKKWGENDKTETNNKKSTE